MSQKVNAKPLIPRPGHLPDVSSLLRFDVDMTRGIIQELTEHAYRLNIALTNDGEETMTAPFRLKSYTVATLPAAGDWTAAMIYVSNETGGAVPAFSDGTNWRRVTDRAIVS